MIRVINLDEKFYDILPILFPTYAYNQELSNKCIWFKDITSKSQLDYLHVVMSDSIIVSKQLFEEVWDKTKIEEEVVKFGHDFLSSKKRKFNLNASDPVTSVKEFLFGGEEEEESALFDTIGTGMFVSTFVRECQCRTPISCIKAVSTFLLKCKTSESLYYLRRRSYATNFMKGIANFYSPCKIPEAVHLWFVYKFISITKV